MWKHAGLLRDKALLDSMPVLTWDAGDKRSWSRRVHEAKSLERIAGAIVKSALGREESRGAHYRSDFPGRNDARYGGRHSLLTGEALSFVSQDEPVFTAR